MEKKCPFCNIDEHQNRIVGRGQHCFVTPSNPRLMRDHLLVIPYRHVGRRRDLTPCERDELNEITDAVEDAVLRLYGPHGGCDVTRHTRPFMAGSRAETLQYSVAGHLHVHVRPRTWEDELWRCSQRFEDELLEQGRLSPEQVAEEARRIQALLDLPS